MATNTFTNAFLKDVGTTAATLYTPPATQKSILIELDVSNTANTGVTVDVYITRSAVNYYIGKQLPVPVGGTLQVVSGQKIVLLATDTIKVVSSVAASIDVVSSILEDI